MAVQGLATCPNLPFGLCPRLWDGSHRPEDTEDDAALYGSDSAGRNPAATWLLVLAALLGMVSLVPSGADALHNPSRTVGLVGLLGLAVGWYLGLELFPAQLLIQVSNKSCPYTWTSLSAHAMLHQPVELRSLLTQDLAIEAVGLHNATAPVAVQCFIPQRAAVHLLI